MTEYQRWLRDALERVGVTFVEAFLSSLILLLTAVDVNDLSAAALWSVFVGALSAGLSAVKAWIARAKGDPASASLVSTVPPPA